jgi:hypothetical protein
MNRIIRRPRTLPFVPVLLLAAALCPSGRALAMDRGGYSMDILVGGTPLQEHAARGTSYVEALKNREYSVRLRNGTGERVAIAFSVDGLNSIDARTTSASEARKWILGPYETITLDGWQTTSTTARRFFFTAEERSYGAWLGQTKNLGIIAAAVFRERRPQPISIWREERQEGSEGKSRDSRGSASPAPPAAKSEASPSRSDDLAATGIGQETSHPVREVSFDSEDSPVARLEVRYEYRDALVRLGVLPREEPRCGDALTRREGARGFEEPRFSPDPYRRRNR